MLALFCMLSDPPLKYLRAVVEKSATWTWGPALIMCENKAGKGPFRGGSYSGTKGVGAKGMESNHIPPKSVSPISPGKPHLVLRIFFISSTSNMNSSPTRIFRILPISSS
jgi:hypothetical protein